MGTYFLDGLPLDDPNGRWLLEGTTGIRIIPSRRSTSVELPGRDGVGPSLRSQFTPGSVQISLLVEGADHGDLMNSLELLAGVIGQRQRLLPLVHDYGNGQKRQAMVEVLTDVNPELVTHQDSLVKVICSVPGAFWRDIGLSDSVLTLTASNSPVVASGLAESTAPISDALIRIQGGFSSAYVEDAVTGDRVTINTAVPSSEYVVIDTAAWTAKKVTSDTWTGGTNLITSVVSNRGSGSMVTFEPDFTTGAGLIRARVVGTGITGSPKVIIRAKRSFL